MLLCVFVLLLLVDFFGAAIFPFTHLLKSLLYTVSKLLLEQFLLSEID